jgi:butyryl-CoA dehydrogenase
MIFTEEQILIRDTARAFAQDKVAPHVRAWEAAGEIPRALLGEMGRLGFMGMCVPAEWGGAGADMVSYVLALEEIAAADGGLSTVMSVNNSPDCAALLAYGSLEQKERWLKPMAKGEVLGAFCLTEPQAGSDASNLRTRAERRGNGWVLNGVKQFITSGRTADVALAFAVTDPVQPKRGISCFIVPTRTAGYRVASVEKKLGQKSSDTCQIAFEDCTVGADALLGVEGEGYRIALANLEAGRIGIAAQAVGMARAAFELARAYASEREAFGMPIINHQAVQFRLADMATKVTVARQMVLHAATLRDAARACLTEAAMAKLYASEMAEEVCSAAIQIHGGYGYVADYLAEKIWRDVRVCQIYEGTSDVQRILIGRGLTTV